MARFRTRIFRPIGAGFTAQPGHCLGTARVISGMLGLVAADSLSAEVQAAFGILAPKTPQLKI
ncbi:MAG: hypothetical protein RL077_5746 [Verrucomicrobiota bacterium]|jgi:hypothetical protein